MKIGYITIQQANYGSVLQTFATSKVINGLGYDCTLIDYKYPTEYHLKNRIGAENKRAKGPVIQRIWLNCLRVFLRMLKGYPLMNSAYYEKISNTTSIKYQAFLSRVKKTEVSYDMESIKNSPPRFDIYMTGSDQTWNPRYYYHDYSFLLNFVDENKPKVSFSASFGSKEFYKEYENDYSALMKQYQFISVREVSGVDIVKRLTGKDAVFTLDPTLLLDADEWAAYESPVDIPKGKYILVYIQKYAMDPYPYADKLIDSVKNLLGIKNVLVITDEISEYAKGNTPVLCAGPKEFIWLFHHADFVISCSFHSVAFSINFRKPFIAISNNKVTNDDRQSNILQILGLEKRSYKIGQALPIKKSDLFMDYSSAERKLKELKYSSFLYLKKILSYEYKR